MQNFFYFVLSAAVALSAVFGLHPTATTFGATPALTVPQGGTGSSTLTGILVGNTTSPVRTLTIGSGLTLTGTTLTASATGASTTLLSDTNTFSGTQNFSTNTGFGIAAPGQAIDVLGKIRAANTLTDATNKAFYFLDRNYTNSQNDFLLVFGQSKVSSNTLIIGGGQTGFTAASTISLFTGAGNNTDAGTARLSVDSVGGVTLSAIGAGAIGANAAGLLYSFASSSLFGYTPLNPTRAINTTYPIQGGGDLSADRTITFGGLGTTSPFTQGQLAEVSNNNTLFSVATGTISGAGGVTVTAGQSIIGSGLTITCTTASSGVAGCLSSTAFDTFNNKENALTFSAPLIRTTNTIAYVGLATTSQPSSSNLLTSNGLAGVYGTATSTLSASGPLTGSFTQVGSGGSLGCTTATGAAAGCLTAADWLTFNGKLGTSTTLTQGQILYVGNGANTATSIATGTITCAGTNSCTTTGLSVIGGNLTITGNGGASSTLLSDFNTFSGGDVFAQATTTAFAVTGSSTFSGLFQSTFSNLLASTTLLGNTLLGPATSSGALAITGSTTIQGALNLAGALSANLSAIIASTTLTGNTLLVSATSSGSIAVTGSTTIKGQLNSTGGAIIASTTLAGTTLFGQATSTGSLSITGSTTIAGALNATGGGFLSLTAATTSSLSVSASTTITGAFNALTNTQLGSTTLWGTSLFVSATTTNLGLTSFKSCSGTTALTTTAAGSVVCGTVTATAGAGGSNGQLQYNNSTVVAGIANTTFQNAGGWLSFGTSTLILKNSPGLAVFGSSTAAQLVLTDNSLTSDNIFTRETGGNWYLGTSSSATFATSTTPIFSFVASTTLQGLLGLFATTTPRTALDVNGQITSGESKVATSTTLTIDWSATNNQVDVQMGTVAMTVQFTNVELGGTKRVLVCNPQTTAGALTWKGGSVILTWAGGTAPTQTTTANQCDVYSFIATQATSTGATIKLFGAGSTGFQ